MPSNFLNWSDVLTANQASGQKMAKNLQDQQAETNNAYGQSYAKYKQDALGSYSSGGQGASTASYGDAYSAQKNAKDQAALAGTNQGRQAMLSKGGKRATWQDAAIAGSSYTGDQQAQQSQWQALQNQFGGADEQAQFAAAGEDYNQRAARAAQQQAMMQADREKNAAAQAARDAAYQEFMDAQKEHDAYSWNEGSGSQERLIKGEHETWNPFVGSNRKSILHNAQLGQLDPEEWKKYQAYYDGTTSAGRTANDSGYYFTPESEKSGRILASDKLSFMKDQYRERRQKSQQRYAAALKAYKASGGKA